MIRIDLQKTNILSGDSLHQSSFYALYLPIPNRSDTAAAAAMQRQLSPAELKKYRTLFRNPRRQQLILSGRFFAKWLAADWLTASGETEVLPRQLTVINRENGAPCICGLPEAGQMQLSISYAQETFLIGCAATGRIGVDLEDRIDPDSNLPSLVLSQQERDLMNSRMFGYDRAQTVLLLWCLKEAILKAVGLGFSRGYLPIEFHTDHTALFLDDRQHVIPEGEQISCLYDINEQLCAVICRIGKDTAHD